MAENKRTSALPDAAALTGLERISVVQDGSSKRTTLQAIIDLVSDTAGTPGSVWRTGAGAPSDGTGIDGDYYLNTSNGDVYYRASGTYSVVANIKGANGTNGTNGTNGAAGSGYGTPSSLTDASSVSWDAAAKPAAVLLVTNAVGGTRAIANPTNLVAGTTYTLKIIQDNVGSRLVTWGSVFKWPNDTAPVLTTTANRTDLFTFYYDGTYLLGALLPNFNLP